MLRAMRTSFMIASSLVLLAGVLFPQPASAQVIDPQKIDFPRLRSNLEAIAPYALKERPTNSDVAMVAAISCDTVRLAQKTYFANVLGPYLESNYPRPDVLKNLSASDFVTYERAIFKDAGFSEAALDLIVKNINESPTFPADISGFEKTLVEQLPVLERMSCGARDVAQTKPADIASEKLTGLARVLGRAVVGIAAIGADLVLSAPVAAVATPFGAGVLEVVSGGWGWNRCEEAYFEGVELLKK